MMARRGILFLGLTTTVVMHGSSLAQAPTVRPLPAPRPAVLAPPTVVTSPPAGYERKGRRDPFQPIETGQEVRLTVAARLKGIVRGAATRALLETPDGIGYILKPGDTLGNGRLIEIGTDSVVFRVPLRRGSTTDRIVLHMTGD